MSKTNKDHYSTAEIKDSAADLVKKAVVKPSNGLRG